MWNKTQIALTTRSKEVAGICIVVPPLERVNARTLKTMENCRSPGKRERHRTAFAFDARTIGAQAYPELKGRGYAQTSLRDFEPPVITRYNFWPYLFFSFRFRSHILNLFEKFLGFQLMTQRLVHLRKHFEGIDPRTFNFQHKFKVVKRRVVGLSC